jgi:glycerol kinase
VAGETRFCLEGMVYSAGSALDWMRTSFRMGNHQALEALARRADTSSGVHFLPALQGLGAPHGDNNRRGLLGGLSLANGPAQIALAGLEGVAFRIREIFDHIYGATDLPRPEILRVDGGLTGNDTLMQIQADILARPVARHAHREATACGAAMLAGRGAGILTEADGQGFVRHDRVFEPRLSPDEAEARLNAWKSQVYGDAA